MSEHEPHHTPEAREVAPTPEELDFRRLEVAIDRFIDRIADGIAQAQAEHTEISQDTARCIAHVLGRARGRDSALADFARTGDGHYLTLRDEYLDIYTDDGADAVTKELIDWLGTYLVQRENTGSGRRFMNEHLPPKLGQLLVATSVRVHGQLFLIHLPANLDSGETDGIIETLGDLQLENDDTLQAFLSLPDVSAGVDDIMEAFHEAHAGSYSSEEAALRNLSPLEDWENSLADWCIDNGVDPEALDWNYEPLLTRLRDLYDLVEWKGTIHAFAR